MEQLDAKTIAHTKVPPIGSTTQDAKIAENRCYSNRSRKTARTCLLFRVLVEQPDAKTIANTKVRQFGTTSQVAKIVDNCC